MTRWTCGRDLPATVTETKTFSTSVWALLLGAAGLPGTAPPASPAARSACPGSCSGRRGRETWWRPWWNPTRSTWFSPRHGWGPTQAGRRDRAKETERKRYHRSQECEQQRRQVTGSARISHHTTILIMKIYKSQEAAIYLFTEKTEHQTSAFSLQLTK